MTIIVFSWLARHTLSVNLMMDERTISTQIMKQCGLKPVEKIVHSIGSLAQMLVRLLNLERKQSVVPVFLEKDFLSTQAIPSTLNTREAFQFISYHILFVFSVFYTFTEFSYPFADGKENCNLSKGTYLKENIVLNKCKHRRGKSNF